MLEIGDSCPEFSLKQQDGKEVSLSDFKGKKILVFFYPRANTSGCSKQAKAASEAKQELQEKYNCEVLGISADTVRKQKNFEVKKELSIDLLSDEEHEVCEKFGVWQLKKMCGKEYMGIVRSSFLIDEDGKVIQTWYKVKPDDTVPKAVEFLSSI
jgi:peroxiredoxin Q/BCP